MPKLNVTLCTIIIFVSILCIILGWLSHMDSPPIETPVRSLDHDTTLPYILNETTKSSYDCALSMLESDQFFCESDDDWYRRKDLFRLQHQRNRFSNSTYMFYQDNYEPTFSCRFERRLGLNGDGGKWICDVYRIAQSSSCLVYSLGSHGEFSFESEIKQALPNCDIHTFDMDAFVCPTNVCTIHKERLGDGKSGSKSLSMIMAELNHTGRYLDILKVDIEGAEFDFFNNLFTTTDHLSRRVRQILFEIHLPKVHVDKTNVINYELIHKLFRLFHENFFVIFHKEVNLYDPHTAFEYGMIRLNERFFQTITTNNTTKQSP